MDMLVDDTGAVVVDASGMTALGIPAQSYSRTVMAVASNEYETGPVAVFGGEYVADNSNDYLTDDKGFVIGLAPVWIDRMVWASQTEDVTCADY